MPKIQALYKKPLYKKMVLRNAGGSKMERKKLSKNCKEVFGTTIGLEIKKLLELKALSSFLEIK